MSIPIQKSLSHSKLPFPETSLIPQMFLNIIPNLSSMSRLTVRSPGGQRDRCSSMSSPTKLVLYLGPRMSLKHWTASGGQKVSPQVQKELIPLVSGPYNARAKVLSSWKLPFLSFFWEDTCLGTQCLFSHLSRQSSQPFPLGKVSLIASSWHQSRQLC